MESIHSAIVFKEANVVSSKEPATSGNIVSMEILLDHYDEPSYFFRGAIFGLIFCIPFWASIFWLIT